MPNWTRRDLLKSGLAASTAGSLAQPGAAVAPPNRGEVPNADQPGDAATGRERLLLDFGWRFHLGNADDATQDFSYGEHYAFAKTGRLFTPSRPDFDDSQWRAIDLPHDWAVELDFVEDRRLVGHGSKPLGRFYPATSIGWYRRVFEIPAGDLGRRLTIEFDGVFRDCIVALNGQYLGRNMSGYAPFRYDITDFAHYGGKNVLVVRVDATEFEGWFYEGAGIYRHVWLVKTDPVHVAYDGTFVFSHLRPGAATVTISTEVDNEHDREVPCRVVSKVLDGTGKVVGTARADPLPVPGRRRRKFQQQVAINKPRLWSVEDPHLYRVVTSVEANGKAVDSYETPFGIRSIRFDAHKGFFLNGRRVEIKGTCNHQDHAGVGSALPDRIQYYRIEKLKEMGANAYRTSHNPPTPELLDACDRRGMLVLDETRMMSSDPEGLSQLERMVLRDRNRPCVICWSLGNEEPEQGTPQGERIVRSMKRLVRRLDPTRPVTAAMNNAWGKGISSVVDIQGCNYKGGPQIDGFHEKFPKQPMMGTEVASTVSTRGIYANDKEKGYVSAYDLNAPRWGATAEEWWKIYGARLFLAGGFVWTGFDYRGEPTPYGWPCISSHFGIIDTCGFPKDNYYYYQAWWGGKPVLHLFPHWNWSGKEGQEIDVWCHSNLERVELFLNGESLGAQDVPHDRHVAWKVKYAPGTLEARGYKGGLQVLFAKRETTGAAAKIVLRPDRQRIRADGEDVSTVAVQLVDQQNRVVPIADNKITFQLLGNGKIIGVGNGDPSSHEPDKAEKRKAFNGLCMAIVQSTKQSGEVRLEATSPGLEPATVVIRCEQATPRPAVA